MNKHKHSAKRNPVAKGNKHNRPATHRDRKKGEKLGYRKHKRESGNEN